MRADAKGDGRATRKGEGSNEAGRVTIMVSSIGVGGGGAVSEGVGVDKGFEED